MITISNDVITKYIAYLIKIGDKSCCNIQQLWL